MGRMTELDDLMEDGVGVAQGASGTPCRFGRDGVCPFPGSCCGHGWLGLTGRKRADGVWRNQRNQNTTHECEQSILEEKTE
jgi:hypothetical protein